MIKDLKEDGYDLKKLLEQIDHIRKIKDYDYFIAYREFAILNDKAFTEYLKKTYSENTYRELKNCREKLRKIKEILEG